MARTPNIHGGGARTNANGLRFEQTTSLEDALENARYKVYGSEVYNGKNWETTDVVEPYKAQFTAVEYTDKELADYLAELSGTPAQDDADGGEGGSGGDGGKDAELTATAAASAKDAGSKSKSAVSTADESPIGTMSVLAALSLLAGGYVVVRKRKKEEI